MTQPIRVRSEKATLPLPDAKKRAARRRRMDLFATPMEIESTKSSEATLLEARQNDPVDDNQQTKTDEEVVKHGE